MLLANAAGHEVFTPCETWKQQPVLARKAYSQVRTHPGAPLGEQHLSEELGPSC